MSEPLTPDELAEWRRWAIAAKGLQDDHPMRRLLATVDAERAARERAEQQLAAIDQWVRNEHLRLPLDLTEYGEGRRDVLNEARALLGVSTTDTPRMMQSVFSHQGPGTVAMADITDTPYPNCSDTPEGP